MDGSFSSVSFISLSSIGRGSCVPRPMYVRITCGVRAYHGRWTLNFLSLETETSLLRTF